MRLVSLLYGVNFVAALVSPAPRALHIYGWLLMAAGFYIMSHVPASVTVRPWERRFRDARWTLGHLTLWCAVLCLFADLLRRKLLA